MKTAFFLATTIACAAAQEGQWEAVRGSAGTGCIDGDFTFFVRRGNSGNVAVDFEGGGACWDGLSCLLPIYTRGVNVNGQLNYLNGNNAGIMSRSDERNPFLRDTQVFVPYCTADAHAGDNEITYDGLGLYKHVGRRNAADAFRWVEENIEDTPNTRVSVTGCSAGSLGAIANAPYLFDKFPQAQKYVFGDSYIGVLGREQYLAGLANWGLEFAPFLEGLSLDRISEWTREIGSTIISESSNYFPDSTWSAFSTNADAVQGSFYLLGGGTEAWTPEMRMIVDFAKGNNTASNFGTFLSPGSGHCVSNTNAIWSTNSNSVNLGDWLSDTVNGRAPRDVDCLGNGC